MDSQTLDSKVDSPGMQATHAVQGSDACMRILIILDITGSMSNEIDAVKQAVAEMVDLCSELQSPSIAFAFITFTEGDDSGCHVSLKETTDPHEAQVYINTIQLSRPPDRPSVNACGDDGPENQKAALARTTDLEPSIPTIAFLITDAEPHLAAHPHSRTAAHELNYLTTQRGLHPDVAGDVFKTFRSTALSHFNGNLILNCVVYWSGSSGASPQQPSATQVLYGSFVQQTGGMLMQPISRQSSILAKGLMDVVKMLLLRVQGAAAGEGAVEAADELPGFKLIDVSGLNPERESERAAAGEVAYGDNAAIFRIAMERMVAVCGSKWSKRAIGMTAPAEQLQFVWRTARYISLCSKPAAANPDAAAQQAAAAAVELDQLLQLHAVILDQLPRDKTGRFSISEDDIQHLAAEAAAAAAAGGGAAGAASVSAISLESVGDALEADATWEDWLAAVMKLLLGFPMHLQLPLDRFGQPDFMDAWSAVVEELGVDRLASSEFMQLLGDAPTATGPTDRLQHNAFLVVVERHDRLASIVFRVASGTQALDYVTGVLMGAKGFLPNLHAGTAAACLMRLISQRSPLTEFQWGQAQQLAHTLACRHRNAAKGVTQQLLAGRANPEDNISKLMLGALRIILCGDGAAVAAAEEEKAKQQKEVLRLVLQELLASMMQRHYGKSTPESDAAYQQSLLQYLPLTALFGSARTAAAATLDPLQQLHPLEQLDITSLDQEQPQQQQLLQPDWQAQLMARLCSGCTSEGVPAHPVVLQFMQRAGRLLALLLPAEGPAAAAAAAAIHAVRSDIWADTCSSSRELQGAATAVAYCWPEWPDGLLQALLLRTRTARYCCCSSSAAEPTDTDRAAGPAATAAGGGCGVVWEPVEVPSCLELVVKRLKEAMAEELQGYRRARSAEAKHQLVVAAAKALQQHPGDWEAASAALDALQLQLGCSFRVCGHSLLLV